MSDNALVWVLARIQQWNNQSGLRSLESVNFEKPLGSWGFDSKAEASVEIEKAKARGLRTQAYKPTRTDPSWRVFVFHEEGLQRVLGGGVCTLANRRAPRQARAFVRWLTDPKAWRQRTFPPRTPIFDLIADCYGDTTSPGRSDSQGNPWELMDALYAHTGQHDEARLYFELQRDGRIS
jgi:hypothetical protein